MRLIKNYTIASSHSSSAASAQTPRGKASRAKAKVKRFLGWDSGDRPAQSTAAADPPIPESSVQAAAKSQLPPIPISVKGPKSAIGEASIGNVVGTPGNQSTAIATTPGHAALHSIVAGYPIIGTLAIVNPGATNPTVGKPMNQKSLRHEPREALSKCSWLILDMIVIQSLLGKQH